MSKRKTVQRGPVTKKAPESKRRWLIVNAKTGKPILGGDDGVSDEAKAHRLSDGYLIDTEVIRHDIYHGLPDPDQEGE